MRSEKEIFDLIDRLSIGENQAWREFFRDFHSFFEGYVIKKAFNLDTDNILSNFYFKLSEDNYRRLLHFTYGGEIGFIKYLKEILRNEILTESKNIAYQNKDLERVPETRLSDEREIILLEDEEIFPGITEEIFLEAIMELKIQPREAIYYLYRGSTNQEIADIMNVSINTVLSWNKRSKERLKIILEKYRGVQ